MDYLKDKDYTYKKKSERDLDEFKKSISSENHFESIETEYKALLAKIESDKKGDILRGRAAGRRAFNAAKLAVHGAAV